MTSVFRLIPSNSSFPIKTKVWIKICSLVDLIQSNSDPPPLYQILEEGAQSCVSSKDRQGRGDVCKSVAPNGHRFGQASHQASHHLGNNRYSIPGITMNYWDFLGFYQDSRKIRLPKPSQDVLGGPRMSQEILGVLGSPRTSQDLLGSPPRTPQNLLESRMKSQ